MISIDKVGKTSLVFGISFFIISKSRFSDFAGVLPLLTAAATCSKQQDVSFGLGMLMTISFAQAINKQFGLSIEKSIFLVGYLLWCLTLVYKVALNSINNREPEIALRP